MEAQQKNPDDGLVPVEVVLRDARIEALPEGERWQGALILIKTVNTAGEGTWSIRRTEGLSDEELLGMLVVATDLQRDRTTYQWTDE